MNVNEDLSYIFSLSRQCMRILGIWPDHSVPLNVFRRPKIGFIVTMCMISLYVFIPQTINVIRSFGNVSRMMEVFVAANFSLLAICKMIFTRYHGKRLRTLMASIISDWVTSKKSWERNAMLKIARSGRKLTIGYFIIAIGTILSAYFVRFKILFKNIHQPRRYLLYRFDYIQKSPNYEITWLIQLAGGTFIVLGNYCIDSFVSILVLYVCGQLINLRIALNNLIDELYNRSISYSKFRKSLTAIVIRHKYLIRTASTIDDCYSPVLFVHLIGASFQLCLVTFQIFTMINTSSLSLFKLIFLTFYTTFALMQLYVYCYAAERLLTESINMAYGAYECKWYGIPPKDAKDLMIIVYRSVVPLNLSAGKFGNFSLELFGIAVKSSMGYLSALLTIAE